MSLPRFSQMAVQDRLDREREEREDELLREREIFAEGATSAPVSAEEPVSKTLEVSPTTDVAPKKQAPVEELPLFAESAKTTQATTLREDSSSEIPSGDLTTKPSPTVTEESPVHVPTPVPTVKLFRRSDQDIPPYKAELVIKLASRPFIKPLPPEALTRTVRELGKLPEQQLLLLAHPMTPISQVRKITRNW